MDGEFCPVTFWREIIECCVLMTKCSVFFGAEWRVGVEFVIRKDHFGSGIFRAKFRHMAAIDSLLKLMDAQGADGLVVVSDDVPNLNKGGDVVRLSMPAIPAELVQTFALEVVGEGLASDLAGGEILEGEYHSSEGSEFAYEVRSTEQAIHLSFRPVEPRPQPGDEAPSESAAHEEPDADPDESQEAALDPCPDNEDRSAKRQLPIVEMGSVQGTPPREIDPRVVAVVEQALAQGASDIFLTSGEHPRIRVGGSVELVSDLKTDRDQILGLGWSTLTADRRAELRASGSVDLALKLTIAGNQQRFRMSIFHHHRGIAAALRPIRPRPPDLEELNLPSDFRELGTYANGLVLITGPAGSGKSTTLAAIIEHINQTRARHIITLEDPIEFEHTAKRALVHQREVGRHVDSFGAGLRAALRESPDVILLGEMRDLPTISAALTAAETGHLVLSTLHTGDTTSAVDRIIDVYPGHQQPQIRIQLASVLRAVVTQMLILSTGYPERVPAIEKLMVNHAVACQIREGRNHQLQSTIQASAAEAMVTLERSLAALVRSGKITLATALKHARDVPSLHKLVNKSR